jgi:hypothetical protein
MIDAKEQLFTLAYYAHEHKAHRASFVVIQRQVVAASLV